MTGPVETTVAGRTDSGVHARGQVVSFDCERKLDTDRTARSLNKLLGDEIVVWDCRLAAEGFNARFSAKSRTYRYFIANTPLLDPLQRHHVWHVPYSLDLVSMNAAAAHLVGEHDFASFCRKAEGRSTERTVLSANWQEGAPLIFEIRATSFCHQMVRSLIALCVEVGRGNIPSDAVPAIIAARDRNAAIGPAPPQGLILWEVGY
jgi:tRNA pseudouridine38-40 synthase